MDRLLNCVYTGKSVIYDDSAGLCVFAIKLYERMEDKTPWCRLKTFFLIRDFYFDMRHNRMTWNGSQ